MTMQLVQPSLAPDGLTEAYLTFGYDYLIDSTALSRREETIVPIVAIDTGSGRKTFSPGFYFEPRNLVSRDKPPSPQTERQISFPVLLLGNSQEEVIDRWNAIEHYFLDAPKGTGPFSHTDPVVFWIRLDGARKFAKYEISGGSIEYVKVPNFHGQAIFAGIITLTTTQFPVDDPQLVGPSGTIANGGLVYVPNVRGTKPAIARITIDTTGASGIVTGIKLGLRSQRILAANDFQAFFPFSSSLHVSAGAWNTLGTQNRPGTGRVQNGLFSWYAVINDPTVTIGPPSNLTATATINPAIGSLPGPIIYYYVVTSIDALGNESVISNGTSVQNLGNLLIFLDNFITGKLDASWVQRNQDSLGQDRRATSGSVTVLPSAHWGLNTQYGVECRATVSPMASDQSYLPLLQSLLAFNDRFEGGKLNTGWIQRNADSLGLARFPTTGSIEVVPSARWLTNTDWGIECRAVIQEAFTGSTVVPLLAATVLYNDRFENGQLGQGWVTVSRDGEGAEHTGTNGTVEVRPAAHYTNPNVSDFGIHCESTVTADLLSVPPDDLGVASHCIERAAPLGLPGQTANAVYAAVALPTGSTTAAGTNHQIYSVLRVILTNSAVWDVVYDVTLGHWDLYKNGASNVSNISGPVAAPSGGTDSFTAWEILCDGTHLTVYLNGAQVTQVIEANLIETIQTGVVLAVGQAFVAVDVYQVVMDKAHIGTNSTLGGVNKAFNTLPTPADLGSCSHYIEHEVTNTNTTNAILVNTVMYPLVVPSSVGAPYIATVQAVMTDSSVFSILYDTSSGHWRGVLNGSSVTNVDLGTMPAAISGGVATKLLWEVTCDAANLRIFLNGVQVNFIATTALMQTVRAGIASSFGVSATVQVTQVASDTGVGYGVTAIGATAATTKGGSNLVTEAPPTAQDTGVSEHCIERPVPTDGLTGNAVLVGMLINNFTAPHIVGNPYLCVFQADLTNSGTLSILYDVQVGWRALLNGSLSGAITLSGPVSPITGGAGTAQYVWEVTCSGTTIAIYLNGSNVGNFTNTALMRSFRTGVVVSFGVNAIVDIYVAAVDSTHIGTGYQYGGYNDEAWTPAANAVNHAVYWQTDALPWHRALTGSALGTFRHANLGQGAVFLAGPPTAAPAVAPALYRGVSTVAGGTQPLLGDPVAATVANGKDELLPLGVFPTPPFARQLGSTEDGWQFQVQAQAGATNLPTVTLKGLLRIPYERTEPYLELSCPALATKGTWVFDLRPDGVSRCAIFNAAGTLIDYATIRGSFELFPGDNLEVLWMSTAAGPDLTLTATVSHRLLPRYAQFVGRT